MAAKKAARKPSLGLTFPGQLKVPRTPTKKQVATRAMMEARVNEIVGLMVKMAWSPQDGARLAEAWKVHRSVVDRAAAEASRQIKSHVRLHEEGVRDELAAAFRHLAARGEQTGQVSAAVKALDALAKIYGVYSPESHSVTHRIDHMGESELAELEKKLTKELSVKPSRKAG